MKNAILSAAVPMCLVVAACGEPMDGSDTADMAPDTTSAETGESDAGALNPAEDGMLDTDVETIEETMEEPMEEQPAADETGY